VKLRYEIHTYARNIHARTVWHVTKEGNKISRQNSTAWRRSLLLRESNLSWTSGEWRSVWWWQGQGHFLEWEDRKDIELIDFVEIYRSWGLGNRTKRPKRYRYIVYMCVYMMGLVCPLSIERKISTKSFFIAFRASLFTFVYHSSWCCDLVPKILRDFASNRGIDYAQISGAHETGMQLLLISAERCSKPRRRSMPNFPD